VRLALVMVRCIRRRARRIGRSRLTLSRGRSRFVLSILCSLGWRRRRRLRLGIRLRLWRRLLRMVIRLARRLGGRLRMRLRLWRRSRLGMGLWGRLGRSLRMRLRLRLRRRQKLRRDLQLRWSSSRCNQDGGDSRGNRRDGHDPGADVQIALVQVIAGARAILASERLCDRASRAVGG
jgi:hypothetical protein